ncbi:hypothetical protein E2C01_042029 [Portunus trituberculatus]|uniref:Uncharacterized protein n=1 Tax=Portunus trituberculatus TaxID=210409 RepID=A0A5B7FLF7_PORTR|nr:hypothetical protein [Portunus trituberculatus]
MHDPTSYPRLLTHPPTNLTLFTCTKTHHSTSSTHPVSHTFRSPTHLTSHIYPPIQISIHLLTYPTMHPPTHPSHKQRPRKRITHPPTQ